MSISLEKTKGQEQSFSLNSPQAAVATEGSAAVLLGFEDTQDHPAWNSSEVFGASSGHPVQGTNW